MRYVIKEFANVEAQILAKATLKLRSATLVIAFANVHLVYLLVLVGESAKAERVVCNYIYNSYKNGSNVQ